MGSEMCIRDSVRMGDVCYESICTEYTKEQIERDVLPEVSKIPGWDNLGSNRQSALISFAWNMGFNFFEVEGFEDMQAALKAGVDHPEAYEDIGCIFGLYSKSYGEQLPGLMYRREVESKEWNKETIRPLKLTASQDTFLKKAPIDDLLLSDSGKEYIEVEEELLVSRLEEIP